MKCLLLQILTICILTRNGNSQVNNKETYRLLASFFAEKRDGKITPFFLDTETLLYKSSSLDVNSVLGASFFDKAVYIGEQRIKADSLISQADFAAMKENVKEHPGSLSLNRKRLKKSGIPFGNFDRSKKINHAIDVYRICLPLFSRNKKTALLYTESYCEGDCGEGSLYVLGKKNGEWAILAIIQIWIA
jgi:hypothetical protein